MNYGYGGEVLLLVESTAPALARRGEWLNLGLEAKWLLCAEICIPEEARLPLAVRIGDGHPSAHAAAVRAALPPAIPRPATFAARDGRLPLELRTGAMATGAIREICFFPRDGSVIDHAAPQPLVRAADLLVVRLTPAQGRAGRPPEWLDGLVEIVDRARRSTSDPRFGCTGLATKTLPEIQDDQPRAGRALARHRLRAPRAQLLHHVAGQDRPGQQHVAGWLRGGVSRCWSRKSLYSQRESGSMADGEGFEPPGP